MQHFGLLGEKLPHSLSPQIHSRLFALSGVQDADYQLIEIPRDAFDDRIDKLLQQYDGLNATIPYKRMILPHLRQISPAASRYGAVNTIDCRTLAGHNTDVVGFLQSIAALGSDLKGDILLLGAGGAGRMMALEAADSCNSLTVAVRDPASDNARALADDLAATGARWQMVSFGEIDGQFSLLLNATPVGMYPHSEGCPVSEQVISRCGAVFDCIYNPRQTLLLRRAQAMGIQALGGMHMLVLQAAAAQHIWLGTDFDPAALAAITAEMEDGLHG